MKLRVEVKDQIDQSRWDVGSRLIAIQIFLIFFSRYDHVDQNWFSLGLKSRTKNWDANTLQLHTYYVEHGAMNPDDEGPTVYEDV